MMDFLHNGLFWLFFVLTGVFMFVYQHGRNTSRLIEHIGGIPLTIILVLSFIFMWWQGGVAILASWLIWAIVEGTVSGLLGRREKSNRQ